MNFLGYVLFLPFIVFYSYILGPALKAVLIPGGLGILLLIMGPKPFFYHMKLAFADYRANKPVELS
ncbi:hypothetical protein [Pseudoalteromonas byunsanensis]|uniref:Uncharacterized protein n=1 Tax=Pseudoalteromonas byunsanensis TaxID=327939 RepID=A0A1S1N9X3_9GAMM|nr:hypothetical protein [Pseudoalteromonas byunsanensis]OHU96478.1 hypothetical protein BIW53_03890 [Pseudoalteromonas byunsanensis]